MPMVTVHYTVYLTSGHHRQPRNTPSEVVDPDGAETPFPFPTGYNVPAKYFAQIKYNGGVDTAQMMFWSVTDGTYGEIYPPGKLPYIMGTNDVTVTAWYFPVGGEGPPPPPAIVDDAFSVALGDFIDDTFVAVTSDPSLTNQANVVGIVPTTSAETLQVTAKVASTGEPFANWLSINAGTPSGDTINVPAGAVGFAFAVYQSIPAPPASPPPLFELVAVLFGGIAVDGGGTAVVGRIPHHVDPWGPRLRQALNNAALVMAGSRGLSPELGSQVRKLAARSLLESIQASIPVIEKLATTEE